MLDTFDFRDLFVLDLANNHQGNASHALEIIRQTGEVVRKHQVRGTFKFQFRQLDTFIHPTHRHRSENRHIPRFLATRLDRSEFSRLHDAVKSEGMLTMCTPFDEDSVDIIADIGFDLIKIASCSARDWPLLEKVAETGMPVIFSTGGLPLSSIDDLVSFFTHRGNEFAIMHCVSLYPIPVQQFHLNQIDVLRNRYPERVIGWSTHEAPDDLVPGQIAVAKGARIFERHVGIPTDSMKLNAYSSTPEQLDRWIGACLYARMLCGDSERYPCKEEVASLDSLRRGVFAKKLIKEGQTITREHVYFAMPFAEGQLDSGHWKDGIVARTAISADAPLTTAAIELPADPDFKVVKSAVHDVKALLNEARIALNSEFQVEYSHHYGLKKFREYGVVIINCINREYCKKLLVQLPGQKHPLHHHKLKEETFQVLFGELNISMDGHVRTLKPGETCLVLPGVWHSFWTDTGAVIEEISTTHYNNDSVYKDRAIQTQPREARKTTVDHWGRYQLFVKTGQQVP